MDNQMRTTDGTPVRERAHTLEIGELCAILGTEIDVESPLSSAGLTCTEAQLRLAKNGANEMQKHKGDSAFVAYLKHLCGLFNLLLLGCSAVSLGLYAIDTSDNTNLYLGIVLLLVALANAGIDWYQQHRTAVLLESFMHLVPQTAAVVREGALVDVPAASVVVGDIVHLHAGGRVPADARLFASNDLRVDMSSITGESEAVLRTAAGGAMQTAGRITDAPNMVFFGSNVASGEGIGIVVATGDATVLGSIAGLAIGETTPPSQLAVEINLFVRRLAAVAVLTALVFAAAALATGTSVSRTFTFMVGLLVAFVPQGLPVTVSLLLTAAAKRMARRNVLVKNLHAVETLGGLTLLATDKTGTLTQNKMTVVSAWLDRRVYATAVHPEEQADESGKHDDASNADSSAKDDGKGELSTNGGSDADNWASPKTVGADRGGAVKGSPIVHPELNAIGSPDDVPVGRGRTVTIAGDGTPTLATVDFPAAGRSAVSDAVVLCSVLCTHARLEAGDAHLPFAARRIVGDATETALLRFGARHLPRGDDVEALWARHGRVFEVPFSSATKVHMVGVRLPDGRTRALLKGAPERVARMCRGMLAAGAAPDRPVVLPWSGAVQREYDEAYGHFASRGQRVLALAMRDVDGSEGVPEDGFVLAGLVALMDPPKHGVRKAVALLRQAGVQVAMVTGDHPATAEAIGRQTGILRGVTRAAAASRLGRPEEEVREDEFDAVVLHGEAMAGMDEAAWDAALAKPEVVFARTTPAQKLEIVVRMQRKGHVVGVTGDGVNDSPALKRADLGVSMNASASDVSKAAAAMILLDDDFASVVSGVHEGRLIFANLQKSIRYTLTHVVPEVLPFVLLVLLGVPAPINPMLVLMVDLGSELAPALSFAAEPPEKELLLLPPRKVLVRPPEEQKKKRSGLAQTWACVTSPFVSGHTGDTLVDGEAMLWVFAQGGVIVSAGCLAAHYATFALYGVPLRVLLRSVATYWQPGAPPLALPDGSELDAQAQMAALGCAQSAYYAGVVIGQLGTLWACKSRWAPPLGRSALANTWTFVGAAVALLIAAVVVYAPWLDTVVLSGGPVPPLALLAPLAAVAVMLAYETARRALVRRGFFGGVPRPNRNLLDIVRSTSSMPLRSK